MKTDDVKKSKPMTFRPTIMTARWLASRRADGWNVSAIINRALETYIRKFPNSKVTQ